MKRLVSKKQYTNMFGSGTIATYRESLNSKWVPTDEKKYCKKDLTIGEIRDACKLLIEQEEMSKEDLFPDGLLYDGFFLSAQDLIRLGFYEDYAEVIRYIASGSLDYWILRFRHKDHFDNIIYDRINELLLFSIDDLIEDLIKPLYDETQEVDAS